MTTAIVSENSVDQESKFKTLLGEKIEETKGRNMFTGVEVHDILLDLWIALNEDLQSVN